MKVKEEKLFVYIALFFGILFVFLVPPFQSPDEDSHFKRSYSIAGGKIYPIQKGNKIGNYFPKEMVNEINDKLSYIGDRDRKYDFSTLVLEQYNKMNYENKVFQNYSTVSVIPIVYLAPALGITCSKGMAHILGMHSVSTTYMLYFARLFSLFFTVFFLYHAIRITPVLKKTMVTISLIPMSVFLSSMVSYDNVLMSLTMLSSAIMLNLIFNANKKKITKKDIVLLSLIGIVLLNVKVLYSLSYVLLFFIPKEKFGDGSRKSILKIMGIILGIVLGGTLLLKLPTLFQHTSSPASLSGKQMSFILKHPFQYLEIIICNIFDQRSFQLNGLVGIFGLLDTYLPLAVVSCFLIYFLVFLFADGANCDKMFLWKKKLVIICYLLLAVVGIYTAMYINWTPEILKEVGGREITGVQGRYFLPLLFPFALLFSFKKVKNNKLFRMILKHYFIVPCIMLSLSVLMILLRYWA